MTLIETLEAKSAAAEPMVTAAMNVNWSDRTDEQRAVIDAQWERRFAIEDARTPAEQVALSYRAWQQQGFND